MKLPLTRFIILMEDLMTNNMKHTQKSSEMLFSERIKEAIKSSKYSQKQIAQILDISEGNISNWKKGQNLPSINVLFKLCVLLEESSDYLLGLENERGEKLYENGNTIINSFNVTKKINKNITNSNGNLTIK